MVSTLHLVRAHPNHDDGDESIGGWTLLQAPTSPGADIGIVDVTAAYRVDRSTVRQQHPSSEEASQRPCRSATIPRWHAHGPVLDQDGRVLPVYLARGRDEASRRCRVRREYLCRYCLFDDATLHLGEVRSGRRPCNGRPCAAQ